MMPAYGLTVPVEIERVIDGDTVVARLPGSAFQWHVRILDCWCCEIKERGGKEAKAFASRIIAAAKQLALHVPLPRKPHELLSGVTFDRLLGHLYVDGELFAEKMIAAGHATKRKVRSVSR